VAGEDRNGMTTEELTAILREVRDRVRARHPQSSGGAAEIPLPDLMPLVRTRDAAEGKVAAIGTVNPRRGGPLNALVQFIKKTVARALDWHVREQVEFNRQVITCLNANLEALNDANRTFSELANRIQDLHRLSDEAAELKDIRAHWSEWRLEWERKLTLNEMQFLRSVADLQLAFQHRSMLMESNFRDIAQSQHRDFEVALDRRALDIQKRLWEDLAKIRAEYEGLIHTELRLIRQRAACVALPASPLPGPSPAGTGSLGFDYGRFAERFRGSADYVKEGQKFYVPIFQGCRNVLDIGCGRGEFLELLREAGVDARGIEQSAELVALCRSRGLEAEEADLFRYLADQPDAAFDGIFCAQVVEHLPPDRLPEMIRLAAEKLQRGGVLVIETPNPECLAIFATHFYLDPTHQRPIPHPLVAFYMEENGLGRIEVHKRSPAVESMPSLEGLPQDFREQFFGGLDYAIVGRKLG
jgi:2-polyprenyl-3-methyl-5-hydroxy-6-metoxy-1,4-benzoquinol methylase